MPVEFAGPDLLGSTETFHDFSFIDLGLSRKELYSGFKQHYTTSNYHYVTMLLDLGKKLCAVNLLL